MYRLNLLVTGLVVAALSGCSFSVSHRGHDGCGEPDGYLQPKQTCRKCGKKAKGRCKTAPLFPGDMYGQWQEPGGCGCGEFVPSYGFQPVQTPFMGAMSGCSSCGTEMSHIGLMPQQMPTMSSGGCASEGGAMSAEYMTPPMVPQRLAPALTPSGGQTVPAPAPPAQNAEPIPSPEKLPPANGNEFSPADEAVPTPFGEPGGDEFGPMDDTVPDSGTLTDPVSWQVPVMR